MKIWLISLIEDNRFKTFIIIAPDREEALECLDREHPNECPEEHILVEDLGTARPAESKLVYQN